MKKLLCILTLLLALVCVLAACETARSITKSEIVNGELVITYNDGTSENLGKAAEYLTSDYYYYYWHRS